MSKAAKQSILILIALLSGAVLFCGKTTLEKVQLEKEKGLLTKQIDQFNSREKEYIVKNKQLEDDAKKLEAANADLKEQFKKLDTVNLKDVDEKIKKISAERDDFQKRVDGLQKERESLLAKLEEKTKALAAVPPSTGQTTSPIPATSNEQIVKAYLPPTSAPGVESDAYWGQVLKEKASIELQLQDLNKKLNDSAVQVVELKKQNGDLQLELNNLKSEKETIEREIKNGNDLADTLSLELARAQNDKKFLNDRLEKMSSDNVTLREQIKRLTSTKIALEKSIVRLQDDKKDVEKKLLETENVIQNRVDEIWQIKDSLDKSLKPQAKGTSKSEIELPPIVVSSNGQTSSPAEDLPSPDKKVGINGNVVSVNDENNFVIVDLGENAGVRLGDNLNVYHGSQFIAGLEVIQVRKDIAAADIKNKTASIQVGDIVR